MKGLIIKQPWINLILSGKKTWEIRGSHTHIRGKIALIQSGSGTILGTAELVDSRALTMEEYQAATAFHGIKGTSQISYRKIHAWVLQNPVRLPEPIPYVHPQGAVIWVNVEEIN